MESRPDRRRPDAAGEVDANSMQPRLELLITERAIRARVARLARRIEARYGAAPEPEGLRLVVVLKGAVMFAADLGRQLRLPVTFDFVAAASYGAGTRSSGTVALAGLERLEIAGRPVLVIEDILDSGRTAAAIIERLRPQGPASLAVCALLRKPAAAALPLPVSAIGFDIADEFVVGYGMDWGERYRNLRDIHRLVLDRGAVARQDGDRWPTDG
ncbi:MAG: hypoxanthine phosphoribosyltransferase [Thiohalocapsa sp.]